MTFIVKTLTIDIRLHDDSISLFAHGIGAAQVTDLHDDPQAAWDQLAAAIGPQIVAAAAHAQQPLRDDIDGGAT